LDLNRLPNRIPLLYGSLSTIPEWLKDITKSSKKSIADSGSNPVPSPFNSLSPQAYNLSMVKNMKHCPI
jgi:hypothetical protein